MGSDQRHDPRSDFLALSMRSREGARYCAHPHDRNASVWQLIQDFMFVVDKKRYQEFLQRVGSLVRDLREDLSGYWDVVVREMGFTDFESEMSEYMSKIEKL